MMFIPVNIISIDLLIQTVINLYLKTSYCITVVSESSLDVHFLTPFTHINTYITDDLNDRILEVSEKGCSDFIVKVNDPQHFMRAFENVTHVGKARRSDKKIIFVPNIEDEIHTTNLLEVLTMDETSFVANILLILPDEKSPKECMRYDLVTHKFVGPNDGIRDPQYLDKWDSCTETFANNQNLFPHDMSNLEGRTVKVACFTYKPYVFLDLDTPLGRDGTEVRIVDEFCRWINCTIALVREDESQWGDIYDNNTGVGVLGNIVEDRADLAITALYSWYEYYIHLDFSAASIRTAITCIAPSPRLLASWQLPFLPFTWSVWIAVFVMLCCTSLAVAAAQEFTSNKAVLTAFAMMIGQSQSAGVANWRVRYVTVFILLTTLVLINAYGAGLASTFTVPNYEKSIDTIQDIIDRNIEWGATHDAWVYSLSLSQEPVIQQLVRQFRIYSTEELKKRSFLRQMAFSIEQLPAGHFAIGEYITREAARDLMLMLEDFYYEYNVVMMRKSSPFTNKMSDFIGRLHETGLLLAWETQVALDHLDNKVQLEVKLSRSIHQPEVAPLSFRLVIGIFFIYFTGTGISVLIFVLELLIKRNRVIVI